MDKITNIDSNHPASLLGSIVGHSSQEILLVLNNNYYYGVETDHGDGLFVNSYSALYSINNFGSARNTRWDIELKDEKRKLTTEAKAYGRPEPDHLLGKYIRLASELGVKVYTIDDNIPATIQEVSGDDLLQLIKSK